MKYNIFFTLTPILGRFFHGSGSGFLADPDPDSEKKADPDLEKKPGSETLLLPINVTRCRVRRLVTSVLDYSSV